jgi:hypothetical protein
MKKRVNVRPPPNWAEMTDAQKDEWNRRSAEAIEERVEGTTPRGGKGRKGDWKNRETE